MSCPDPEYGRVEEQIPEIRRRMRVRHRQRLILADEKLSVSDLLLDLYSTDIEMRRIARDRLEHHPPAELYGFMDESNRDRQEVWVYMSSYKVSQAILSRQKFLNWFSPDDLRSQSYEKYREAVENPKFISRERHDKLWRQWCRYFAGIARNTLTEMEKTDFGESIEAAWLGQADNALICAQETAKRLSAAPPAGLSTPLEEWLSLSRGPIPVLDDTQMTGVRGILYAYSRNINTGSWLFDFRKAPEDALAAPLGIVESVLTHLKKRYRPSRVDEVEVIEAIALENAIDPPLVAQVIRLISSHVRTDLAKNGFDEIDEESQAEPEVDYWYDFDVPNNTLAISMEELESLRLTLIQALGEKLEGQPFSDGRKALRALKEPLEFIKFQFESRDANALCEQIDNSTNPGAKKGQPPRLVAENILWGEKEFVDHHNKWREENSLDALGAKTMHFVGDYNRWRQERGIAELTRDTADKHRERVMTAIHADEVLERTCVALVKAAVVCHALKAWVTPDGQ